MDSTRDLESDLDLRFCSETLKNFRPVFEPRLYRSARVDAASQQDVELFRKLGIKTIIDLRASNETKTLGMKGVPDNDIIIKDYFVPHTVEAAKHPGQGHTKVKDQDNQSRSNEEQNDANKSSYSLRSRKNPSQNQEKTTENENLHHLKFNATHEPAVGSAVQGKWLFLNLINLKILFFGALKALPWFAKFIAVFAVVIDAIFKTKLLLWTLGRFASKNTGLDGSYCAMAEQSGPGFSTAFRVLLEPNVLPAVYTCRMGKDRTGVICALVQRLCGVPKDVIVKDYAVSEVYMKDKLEEMKLDFTSAGIDESFAFTKPKTMEYFLNWLDKRYGSVEGYMSSIGFGEDEQEKLKRIMRQGH